MKEYFVGNAVLGSEDKCPAIVSFDGKEYELYGFGDSFAAIADVMSLFSIRYKNLPVKVHVDKYRHADIVPLNKEGIQNLITAIKLEKRSSRENFAEKESLEEKYNLSRS